MQFLIMCSGILSNTVYAQTPSKKELLSHWEQLQKSSVELKTFNKVDDKTYFISFNNIPFEGNIELININIDELTYETTLPVNYMGIVEIKLPEELEKLKESYSHSFHRWQESTYFYYNDDSNVWLTGKEYDKLSANLYQTLEPTKLSKLMKQYSGEVTVGLIFLFITIMLIQLMLLWKIKQKITK